MSSKIDTKFLWRTLLWSIGAILGGILFILSYSYLEQSLPNKKRLSSAEKAEYARKRGLSYDRARENDFNRVENGIHVQTGMVYDQNFQVVRATCTSCHSAKLITQNRATREGWKQMIVWMQETQGLPDLGDQEPVILDYLATHYAPKEVGRRQNLDLAEVEWYILNLE